MKGFNTQNALLSMVKNMLLACDKRQVCGAILTDLSNAFDNINHDLRIIKLHANEFDRNALKVTHDYLSGRHKKLK